MTARTRFPVVFVHGIFGYGREYPAWGLWSPYWPEAALARINPNHIIVDVGPISSDHDRACEVFYQLRGGTVDYGEAHARETQHERFGPTYAQAKHPLWSETHPIHLVGHSMGSTTAIELYQLICADAFGVGSNHRWVRSITSIAGPLTGSTITHMLGIQETTVRKWTAMYVFSVALGTWFKIYSALPFLRGAYDLRVDQWRCCPLSEVIAIDGRFHRSLDMGMYTCLPALRIQRNSQLRFMDKLFLLSIATSPRSFHFPTFDVAMAVILAVLHIPTLSRRLPKILRGAGMWGLRRWITLFAVVSLWRRVRGLNYAKIPSFFAFRWLMRRQARVWEAAFSGFDPEHWVHNDGAVNIHSMLRPWFPKPQELATSRSTLAVDAGGDGETLRLSASSDSLVSASAPVSRCASHVSIDGFHGDSGVDASERSGSALRAGRRFERGRWYVYRVDCNHFAGTQWDGEAADLYESLFRMMIEEYEDEPTDFVLEGAFRPLRPLEDPAAPDNGGGDTQQPQQQPIQQQQQ